MKKVKIELIKPNPKNPRVISGDKYLKLMNSIKEFPDMLNKRPLVVFTDKDGKYVVIGGNMRLKACKEVGMKEIPIIIADEWSEEQKAEFIIKDNVGYGEWDWDSLANEWDAEQLDDWGLDANIEWNKLEEEQVSLIKQHNDSGDKYLNNIVRQILLVFDNETHKVVLEKMKAIGEKYNIHEDNSAVVLKLIDYYEGN